MVEVASLEAESIGRGMDRGGQASVQLSPSHVTPKGEYNCSPTDVQDMDHMDES